MTGPFNHRFSMIIYVKLLKDSCYLRSSNIISSVQNLFPSKLRPSYRTQGTASPLLKNSHASTPAPSRGSTSIHIPSWMRSWVEKKVEKNMVIELHQQVAICCHKLPRVILILLLSAKKKASNQLLDKLNQAAERVSSDWRTKTWAPFSILGRSQVPRWGQHWKLNEADGKA